ncbi:uncharacterized protein FOMMEDRAFT_150860 [Fomitiporia mediterranea MF3/22]|uniref:uncharacterized protein n=1 Tax=Fomitiporia mediterranea (strain MF3/22) TaxID=694068 RepID=UPI0004409B43|nr:uncharacterized protein FOMMEDRAFT_150860 [Fomitiporia mediterranea MF3/22]EJD08164.1 hypothetical protein FOMMEDRAFT_150860 [Fomitiporia mediterranea MF3/22]
MPLPTYFPHIVYTTALTSLALHLLSTRKEGEASRQHTEARIGLLEGLASRLHAGERVSEEEIGKVRRLMREGGVVEDATAGHGDRKLCVELLAV